MKKTTLRRRIHLRQAGVAVAMACCLVASATWVGARQAEGSRVALDADDIGGVVTNAGRPEAGVWVVAETQDLETRFIRIVVTDDQGRYVVPDLPQATYEVFVRGYGLVDSPRVNATPGQQLDLSAVPAADAKTASMLYPANYWLSLMAVPSGDLSVAAVASTVKNCLQCHQIRRPGHAGDPPSAGHVQHEPRRLGCSGGGWAEWPRHGKYVRATGSTTRSVFRVVGPHCGRGVPTPAAAEAEWSRT